jgi:hypothetical protein
VEVAAHRAVRQDPLAHQAGQQAAAQPVAEQRAPIRPEMLTPLAM